MHVRCSAENRVDPMKICQEKKAHDEKSCEIKKAPHGRPFAFQVHENRADHAYLESGHEQRNDNVALLRSEIDIGKENGETGEKKQRETDAVVELQMHLMRAMWPYMRIVRVRRR